MSLRMWIIAAVISVVLMALVVLVIAYGFDDGDEGDDAAYRVAGAETAPVAEAFAGEIA